MPIGADAAYFFTGFLILLGIIVKRSPLLYAIQFIWMILLLGGNTFALDFPINEALYEAIGNSGYDFSILGFAYQISADYANQYGLEFTTYNLLITIFSVLLIAWQIQKHARNYNLAFALLYLYPFVEMVIQKRFLPAMALSLWALQYLNRDGWKNQAKFFGIFILALGFHSAVVFYIVFWLLDRFTHKGFTRNKKFIMALIWGGLCVVSSMIPSLAGIIFPADKVELYFETYAESSDIFKFLFWASLHLSVVFLVAHIYRKVPQTAYTNLVFRLNIYSLFIIPLYAFDPVFMRYLRAVLIFNYMFLGDFFPERLLVRKLDLKAGGGIVLLSIIFCLVWYYLGIGNMTYERMVAPIFQYNMFIS